MRSFTGWKAVEVQLALFRWLEMRGRRMVLPNFTPRGWHECDMFSMTQAMYFHEIEVKVSRSDFRSDFNKRGKHRGLAGTSYDSHLSHRPRTFCYAAPQGLLMVEDMPDYAGLIVVRDKWVKPYPGSPPAYEVEVLKKPPVLKVGKLSAEQMLRMTECLWYRYANTWKELAVRKIEGVSDGR